MLLGPEQYCLVPKSAATDFTPSGNYESNPTYIRII